MRQMMVAAANQQTLGPQSLKPDQRHMIKQGKFHRTRSDARKLQHFSGRVLASLVRSDLDSKEAWAIIA